MKTAPASQSETLGVFVELLLELDAMRKKNDEAPANEPGQEIHNASGGEGEAVESRSLLPDHRKVSSHDFSQ